MRLKYALSLPICSFPKKLNCLKHYGKTMTTDLAIAKYLGLSLTQINCTIAWICEEIKLFPIQQLNDCYQYDINLTFADSIYRLEDGTYIVDSFAYSLVLHSLESTQSLHQVLINLLNQISTGH